MWSRCRPRALAAHDAAHGGGVGRNATWQYTPPALLRMLYPSRAAPKVIAVVRNPTDRLETSFWLHPHYPRQYGHTADGLDAYVTQHLAVFRACEAAHGTRRCAFLFENLEARFNAESFFACDQVIRGVYWCVHTQPLHLSPMLASAPPSDAEPFLSHAQALPRRMARSVRSAWRAPRASRRTDAGRTRCPPPTVAPLSRPRDCATTRQCHRRGRPSGVHGDARGDAAILRRQADAQSHARGT